MSAETDDYVILLSSDSSAPNSPVNKLGHKQNLDSGSEDDNSVKTEIYSPPVLNNKSSENANRPITESLSSVDPLVSNIQKSNLDSDAESDITLDDFPPLDLSDLGCKNNEIQNDIKQQLEKINYRQLSKIHELSDSDDGGDVAVEYECSSKDEQSINDQRFGNGELLENGSEKAKRKRKAGNAFASEERERKKAEKLQKQAQKAQDKALKQATNVALRCKKPEECIKYIRVCLDQQLLTSEYGGQVLVALQAGEMQYNIQSNPVPYSIIWTRDTPEHLVGDDLKVVVKSVVKEENEVMIVWDWGRVLRLVHSGDLLSEVQILENNFHGKTLTLVVYGAETREYFKYQKIFKKREVKAQVLGTEAKTKVSKKMADFEKGPQVSWQQWETAFAQLQLHGCFYTMMDNPETLGTYIRQFTKAIAEAPFKREKKEEEQEKMEWYGEGDSRDCVKVDKNGNGLLRLWQQQLCQFNSVRLETAQAIASVYKSPRALIQAYENCSSEREAQLLLASIPVRRGVGPLTTVKTVGPELSKRIHAFFTAVDGDSEICDDE